MLNVPMGHGVRATGSRSCPWLGSGIWTPGSQGLGHGATGPRCHWATGQSDLANAVVTQNASSCKVNSDI